MKHTKKKKPTVKVKNKLKERITKTTELTSKNGLIDRGVIKNDIRSLLNRVKSIDRRTKSHNNEFYDNRERLRLLHERFVEISDIILQFEKNYYDTIEKVNKNILDIYKNQNDLFIQHKQILDNQTKMIAVLAKIDDQTTLKDVPTSKIPPKPLSIWEQVFGSKA